jgi:hypothetical protein
MAYSGPFFPTQPKKYRGDVNKIFYRSLWERNVMTKLDTWAQILEWSSEELVIPYRSPVDNKIHRYFPDFQVRMQTPTGIRNAILEVKPKSQCKEPKKPKRVTKRFISEVKEFATNQAKWGAATAYCADRGWDFMVLTEDDIFGKTTK